LAVVMPALWSVARDEKRAKILQFGERVFDIVGTISDENATIDKIIVRLREFFESLEVKTRFSDYGMGQEEVEVILAGLAKYGQGEPEFNRCVLELAI
jgi:NADP-dependent alcohol dehydrogenase